MANSSVRVTRRGVRTAVALGLVVLALVVGLNAAVAQDHDTGAEELDIDHEAEEAAAALRERTAGILEEAAGLPSHAWAGEYYLGYGVGTSIRMALAPQGGVAATWVGCTGTYAANDGQIEVSDDGSLQLRYASTNEEDDAFPGQLVPVAWGERRYLIEPAQMMAFVNAINLDREPRANRQGSFLLARGDETRPAPGLPALPARWLPLIRSEAIEVRVRAIEAQTAIRNEHSCILPFRLTLDHGADIGLATGVELERTSPSYGFARIEVIDVDAATSIAQLELYDTTCAEARQWPVVGWVFSTGALGWDPFDDSAAE